MENQEIKKYTNGDITVIWQSSKCIHCGYCAKGLPSVFKPKEKPWVKMNAAITTEIIDQVNKCPSGALTVQKI